MAQQPGTATASTQLENANRFNITGPIVISYSQSSFAEPPQLSYKDAELDLNFSGADITQADSPMGELVTVTIEDAPDAFIRTFTLIVPKIRLRMGDEVTFDALGIETIDRSGARASSEPNGCAANLSVHQLQGTAQAVRFLSLSKHRGGGATQSIERGMDDARERSCVVTQGR